MNLTRKNLVCILFLFLTGTISIYAQTPVAANGKLKVTGTNLVNESGTPIQLRGMSSHGINWFTEDYNFQSLNVMANNWGADVFRIAMYPTEQPDQTKGGYEGNPAFWKKYIDELVDLTGQFGMYCIIDWHVLTPGDPSNATYLPMAKEFWGYMSQKHAGKDHVLYEICNEPNGVSWSVVKNYAMQIIPIIRANDPNTIILVGSPTWSSDVDVAANDPITGYSNIMYSFHFYAGSHGQNYRDKVTAALSKGLAIFATEWGTTNADGGGGVNTTESTVWLNFMRTNNISWCNWSYSDKNESSAVLVPYSVADNEYNTLSTSGTFIKNAIQTPADSWPGSGNKPPVASITSPLNGSYALPGTPVTITASAVDGNGTVSSVNFLVDGTSIGTDNTAPYSIQWTPASVKNYVITARATDNSSTTGTSLPVTYHVVSSINQTAYPDGTPWPIPGTIATYNFDNGGEMIAYHDVDGVHKAPAGALRASEGVDVEGSTNIGYILNGEWLEYTVDIATTGNYQFSINVASGYPVTGKLHLECDGIAVSPVTNVPSSGNWGSYQAVTIPDVQLPEGEHVIRLVFDKGYFNTSTMQFTAVTVPPTITLTAPAGNISVGQGTAVTLSANASDSDGSISKVEFLVGTSVVATDNTAPYSASWIPQLSGTYSVSAKAYDNMLSTATSVSRTVTVTSDLDPPTTPNLALNRPATASSVETTDLPAGNAVDGSAATRWGSEFGDPQWIRVDLQTAQVVNRVILNWEAAFATRYQIQVSSNATTWTTVADIVGGNGGIDDIIFADVTARYVRMYGTERTTPYGYSLYEFEVYGPDGTNVPVTGVSVTPLTASIEVNGTQQLTATVAPANATNKTVTWTSSGTAIATVSSSGLVTGRAAGSAVITARTQDGGFTATSTITVTTVTIPVTGVSVTPTSASIEVNGTQQLTATVAPANATNKTVTWTSSGTAIATVSSSGLVTGRAAGSAVITARTQDGGFTATSTITVTTVTIPVTGVSVTPTSASVEVNGTQQLTATVAPANATNKTVTWASSGTAIATVSSAGLVTGRATGSVTITVTTADGGFTATSTITVSDGEITPCDNPVSVSLPKVQNGTGEFCWVTSGNITYVNSWNMTTVEINGVDFTNKWSNSMPARIDGNYYIYYRSTVGWAHLEVNGTDGGNVPVTGVSVTPTTASVNVNGTQQLTATVAPANATNKAVTWTSGSTAIATVSSSGLVTGRAAGSAVVTVRTQDGGFTATSTITVTTANVPVTGVSVTPTTASVNVNGTQQLTATVAPANATNKTVTWTSGSTAIATVSSSGLVTGRAAGSAVITVRTQDGGFTATSTITVTTANVPVTGVSVTPTTATLAVNGTQQLTATVAPANATNKTVTWTSGSTAIATVSSSGLVTGRAAGSAVITVRTQDGGFTATCAVTVEDGGQQGCDNPVAISIPFVQNGAGEYCWVTTTAMAYINSWALTELTINGVDFTNIWSDNLPPAQNGQWEIHYVGNYGWSHFEAPAAKDAELSQTADYRVDVYPNPFSSDLHIDLETEEEVLNVEVVNSMGQVIAVVDKDQLNHQSFSIGMEDASEGMYIIRILTESQLITRVIVKNQ